MTDSISRHLCIFGRVQGVGYRWHMTEKANELGVTGWVRNRREGYVEAIVQGQPESVAAMLNWAQQGPSSAQVDYVEVEESQASFNAFSQRPTL